MPHDRQAAAPVGTVERERADDGDAVRAQHLLETLDIEGSVGGIGEDARIPRLAPVDNKQDRRDGALSREAVEAIDLSACDWGLRDPGYRTNLREFVRCFAARVRNAR